MNSVKLEIMSVALPKEEGAFWRRTAAKLKVRGQLGRSRGDLQKFLMLEGLKAVCRRSAKELVAIRKDFSPRALSATVLLLTLALGQVGHLVQAKRHPDLRPIARAQRAAKVRWSATTGDDGIVV